MVTTFGKGPAPRATPAGRPAGVGDLPLELIDAILGHLDFAGLLSAARVSRAFRALAWPRVERWVRGNAMGPNEWRAVVALPDWAPVAEALAAAGAPLKREFILKIAVGIRACRCLRCLADPRHPLAGRGAPAAAAAADYAAFDPHFAPGYRVDEVRRAREDGPPWFTVHKISDCRCAYCVPYIDSDGESSEFEFRDFGRWVWDDASAIVDPGGARSGDPGDPEAEELEAAGIARRALDGWATRRDVERAAELSSVLALEVGASCGRLPLAARLVGLGWVGGMPDAARRVLYGRRAVGDAALAAPLGPLDGTLPAQLDGRPDPLGADPAPWLAPLLASLTPRRRAFLAEYVRRSPPHDFAVLAARVAEYARANPGATIAQAAARIRQLNSTVGYYRRTWAEGKRYAQYDALAPLAARYGMPRPAASYAFYFPCKAR